jgi:hypothetical protein
VVGFALAGWGTNYGLSDGLGGGHSDMFQAAVYSTTRMNGAYVSTALAYGPPPFRCIERSASLNGYDLFIL